METSHAHQTPSTLPHLLAGNRPAAVTLVRNGKLDTLALGQRDPWLLLTDDAIRG